MIMRKFKKNIVKSENPIPYQIGFINNNKMVDETELDATDIHELESLWMSICKEFSVAANSVCYVNRA